jgi:serine/threonine-protein kinase
MTAFQVNQIHLGRGAALTVGPYVLLERIGRGGMGEVFKARHHAMGRLVALKVIHRRHVSAGRTRARFLREAEAAARLDHPNIVHAYDAGWQGGICYLAMEYVEGADLDQVVARAGPLPARQACDCARQAALGLQHAFARGVVHRDLKPSNLLLSAAGQVKVLDLGLARCEAAEDEPDGPLTRPGQVLGTPDYMAPEQAGDSQAADTRSDLYSLGCTLYFLLTGQPPFPEGSPIHKVLRHLKEEPAPLEAGRPGLPPGVATVVRTLMAKRPECRYQTPAEAAAALAPLCVAPTSGKSPPRPGATDPGQN